MIRLFLIAPLWFYLPVSFATPPGSAQAASPNERLAQAARIDPRITHAHWQKLDAAAQARFISDQEQEYIILLAAGTTPDSANTQPARKRQSIRDIAAVQQHLRNQWSAQEIVWRKEYRNLPAAKIFFPNKMRLYDLLADDGVIAVAEDRLYQPALAQSLPLISQPQAAAGGLSGAGANIAVVDTGVDYTNPFFGCTAPGIPGRCRIAHQENIALPDEAPTSHGTLVAAIAASVATGNKIVSLDVRGPSGILTSDLVAAIDWIITHKEAYNLVAANFSLASDTVSDTLCDNIYDPLYVGFVYLQENGVLPVAASGNGGIGNGISAPACYSAAFSVGATFDQDFASHPSCGGASVTEDQVACFSNGAYFLNMLAPGANISAAGYQGSGTSMAAPHVTAAAAMVMARSPDLTLEELKARLTGSSVEVLDTRNGYSFPRLDLSRALKPQNDAFANAKTVSLPLTFADTSVFATAESGEVAGIRSSVWYRFTAASPVYWVGLTTAAPLVVRIYRGTGGLAQLTPVATISPGNSVPVNLQPGVQYFVQVYSSGAGGAFDLSFVRYADESIPFVPAWGLMGLALLMGAALRRRG